MRRLLSFVWVAALASSCTCGGCLRTSAQPEPAPPTTVTTPKAEPAPAENAEAPTAEPDDDEPADHAGTLPTEVVNSAPPDDAIIAAFREDCSHPVTFAFEDMTGERDAGECDARMFEQNCSPDRFGCWDRSEKCRDDCAAPCDSCQAACANTCESCKSSCDGGDCLDDCAVGRNECRKKCLRRLEYCRGTTCQKELDGCEADAKKRTEDQCPDCDEIRQCLGDSEARDGCADKFPKDAKECLEWCSPDM